MTALSDAYRLVRYNPIVLGVGWIGAVILGAVNVVLGIVPILGVLSLFLSPVFLAGMLALVYSGRNGNAAASDFAGGVVDHYPSLLGGTLLFGLVTTGTLLVGVFVPAVLMPATGGIDAGFGGGAMATAFLVVFSLVGLLLLVFGVLFQFFDVAIVVDDASVLDAFGHSFDVFTSAPLSVVGYTVLRTLLGVLFFVAPLVALVTAATGLVSAASVGAGGGDVVGAVGVVALGLGLAYVLVLIPLGQVALLTYHVAFYNRFTATAR